MSSPKPVEAMDRTAMKLEALALARKLNEGRSSLSVVLAIPVLRQRLEQDEARYDALCKALRAG